MRALLIISLLAVIACKKESAETKTPRAAMVLMDSAHMANTKWVKIEQGNINSSETVTIDYHYEFTEDSFFHYSTRKDISIDRYSYQIKGTMCTSKWEWHIEPDYNYRNWEKVNGADKITYQFITYSDSLYSWNALTDPDQKRIFLWGVKE